MYAKKVLGQHFLRCLWVAQTMIKTAGVTKDDTVLEVGPGRGELTIELARHAGRVVAVEKDERLAETLRSNFVKTGVRNAEVVTGDILSFLKSYETRSRKIAGFKVVGNIPYYLTSRLIRVLLENEPKPETIVLTIQKEVAQKITAKPPKMNLLALSVQIFGTPEIIKKVPAECFSPKPTVESAILKISDISDKKLRNAGVSQEAFFIVAKALFNGKRKIILNNLANLAGKEKALEVLARSGINEQKRAQELSAEEILRLAKSV